MICINCVTPLPLKKFIEGKRKNGKCSYCEKSNEVTEKKDLFNYIFECVKLNVAVESDLSDYELGMIYECGDDSISIAEIDEVLMDWMGLHDECYADDLLQAIPSELEVNDDHIEVHFYEDDGNLEVNIYEIRWDSFVEKILHDHRFFNPEANDFLNEVFSLLVSEGLLLKPEVIRTLSHGDKLYRARKVENEKGAEKITSEPDAQFGPTPRQRAASQRMTPNGISALYCALERATCLSEIRAITGDYVVSTAITPINQIKLLDLTALSKVEAPELTLLDLGCRQSLHLKVFLNSLVKKLSRPKGPNDELSYLPTQVVFEYLRRKFRNQVSGLVFPSVQTGEEGTNVVLFPEVSKLASSSIIASSTISNSLPVTDAPINPFDEPALVAIVHNSIRFHKITAVKTQAIECEKTWDMFMSDLTRRRLGMPFAKHE